MSILQTKRSLVKAKVYGLLMHFGREKPILWLWKLKGQNVDYLEKPRLAERSRRSTKIMFGQSGAPANQRRGMDQPRWRRSS